MSMVRLCKEGLVKETNVTDVREGEHWVKCSVTTAVCFLFWCLCVLLHEVCMSQKNILLSLTSYNLWLVFVFFVLFFGGGGSGFFFVCLGFFGRGELTCLKTKESKETKFLCHSFVLCYAFPSRPHWASGGKQKSLFQSQLWSKKLLSHTEQLMERSWDMTLLQ